jgi:endonuclease I
VYSVSVGDTIDYSGYSDFSSYETVVDENISNQADTSIPGTYVETYEASNGTGDTEIIEVTVLVLSPYYNQAVGLYGDDLLLSLRTIINSNTTMTSYEDATTMLATTDIDPNNPDNLILMYLGTSVDSTWDSGTTWNREHVWPQSLLGVDAENSTTNAASDLHNLKPADPGTNSSRGNKYFDSTTGSLSYEPRDEVKGDIARILFYMEVMYDIYDLINGTPAVYQMAMLDTLVTWHDFDPVDTFESNRNDSIFGFQGNRNPFIDYPDFYQMIYDETITN